LADELKGNGGGVKMSTGSISIELTTIVAGCHKLSLKRDDCGKWSFYTTSPLFEPADVTDLIKRACDLELGCYLEDLHQNDLRQQAEFKPRYKHFAI
jgi:hypothetical protein